MPANRPRQIAGNAAWLLIGEAFAKLASFGFVLVVARGLGARQYGYVNFAVSFAPLFLVFGTWGLNAAVIRELARRPERLSELYASGLALRVGMGVTALALAIGLSPLLVDGRQAFLAFLIVAFALFVDELTDFAGTVFKAFERMSFHALSIVINRVLSTLLSLAVLAGGGGLLAVCGTYLLGSVGALLFAQLSLRRWFPPVHLRDASRATMWELARQGAPLGVTSALGIAMLRLDAVLLQAMRGPVAVGLYGVAFRFFESFLFISWSLANAAFPRLARRRDDESWQRTLAVTAAVMLAFYVPLAAVMPFAGRWAVTFLFSDRYAAAADAVAWLAGGAVFYGLAHLGRVTAVSLDQRGSLVWIAATVLVFNVAFNLVAIPQWGFVGAAAATFFTEVLEAALMVGLVIRAGPGIRFLEAVAVPLAAGAVMVGVLAVSGVRDGWAVLVGAAVYLPAMALGARRVVPDLRAAWALSGSGEAELAEDVEHDLR